MAEKPPPSAWAIALATAIVTGLAGYFLGQASSIGLFGGSASKAAHGGSKKRVDESDISDAAAAEDDDEEDDEEEGDEDRQDQLEGFSDRVEPCKLVLVVRTDLGMTKGKIAAQCGHATLACYKTLHNDPAGSIILQRWEKYGQAKIAVQVKSEEELELLQAQAMNLGICARIIHDAGRTQIASGSATVLGVGPAPESMVNQVTGGLKLL